MQEPTVGVIGLGIMGGAVSGNMLRAGFRVIGCDLLPERVASPGGAGRAGCTLGARGGRGGARDHHALAQSPHSSRWSRVSRG